MKGVNTTMDIEKISQLIALLDNTTVAEIEIKEGENSVKITRQGKISAPAQVTTAFVAPNDFVPHAVVEIPNPATAISQAQAQTQASAKAVEFTGHVVRSPMVGTVYLAPSPTAKPFVSIGQLVKAGDVLCIVEAMKMMNQIEAEKGGTIRECMVENALPVEFDQPLFMIE